MTAPEPRANPMLIGHEAAEVTIAAAMRSGRMHHAWLITGPDGVGKATLAYRFARRLLAGTEPNRRPGRGWTCRRRTRVPPRCRGSHADLLTVERGMDDKRKRERREIVVDEVREVAEFLRLTPAEGGWRVVIVDGAEEMNRNAANALLKVLEEPPRGRCCCSPARRPAGCPPPSAAAAGACASPRSARRTCTCFWRAICLTSTPRRVAGSAIADGSPGRALALAEGEGLGLAARGGCDPGGAARLPGLRAYAIADGLGRGEDAFSTYHGHVARIARPGVARNAARAGGRRAGAAGRPAPA